MSAVAAIDGIDDRDIPKMELLTAAFNNDSKKIDALMREGQVHIDSTDDDDVTALHIAAATGNNHLVRRLLDYGANIEACNQLGMTAFHHAAREGKLSVIDTLLQRGANFRKLTFMGVNALTLASAGGHTDVVKKLLSLREENWRSEPRNRSLSPTPLIAATCFKSSQICSYLIRAGAQIDETIDTLKGLSALSTAIICTSGVYMVTSLLDLGANPVKRSLHRMNAMELANLFKRKDIFNVLYEKRAPRMKMENQYDIREIIAEDAIIERVVDQPSQDGCTFLMFATIVRSVNSARGLIQHNVDVNARDNMHITAIQFASLLRIDDILQLLLMRNAQTYEANKYGLNAWDLFHLSSDILESHNLRALLHPHRPMQTDSKLNFSSSSSSLYKTLQPNRWFNKISSQIMPSPVERQPEAIEPRHWLDSITQYQPAKDRNSCKFVFVDEILRGARTVRPPETNVFDMITEAAKSYMEENQSFLCGCFTDSYGEKEEQQRGPGASNQSKLDYYDIAQEHSERSRLAEPKLHIRKGFGVYRKDSLDNTPSERQRRPRTIAMVESPLQNQMRTTPRMLKKSRDVMGDASGAENGRYHSAQYSRSHRMSSIHVPTVLVNGEGRRSMSYVITDEMVWLQLSRRNKAELIAKLKNEEIDRYSFMSLTEANLQEMGIGSKEDWLVIRETQRSLKTGSL